jgi:hypothetical protein
MHSWLGITRSQGCVASSRSYFDPGHRRIIDQILTTKGQGLSAWQGSSYGQVFNGISGVRRDLDQSAG